MSLKIPTVESINEQASRNAFRLEDLPWDKGTDHGRFFGPEEMSHLYYCPSYALLTPEEKRFYNQVHAGGICEQFVFLEEMLLVHGLGSLLRRTRLCPPMREAITTFVEEEKKHALMFERLLKLADPEVYGKTRYAVYVLNRFETGFMRFCLDRPETFLWWIWIAVLFEEKTLDFYRKYLAVADPESIDPLFLAVHRAHAMEEIRHFQLDHHFVDLFWETAPAWKRWFNEQLFRRMMWHFTHPHRTVRYAVLKVVDRFPRLVPMKDQLLKEIHAVFENPLWQEAFYSRRVLPHTFALFDRFPELHRLKNVFPLYTPECASR